jgi:hypothetical protein
MMFMMFHAPKERRPLLIAIFGSFVAIGTALLIIF